MKEKLDVGCTNLVRRGSQHFVYMFNSFLMKIIPFGAVETKIKAAYNQ